MSEIYKHYKGGIYELIGVGKNTETNEDLVFYKDASDQLWARPKEMFFEEIEVNGVKTKRFEHVGFGLIKEE